MQQLQRLRHRTLFEGPGSSFYNLLVPRFTRRLHEWVINDVTASNLQHEGGTVLDVGTGPGHLVLRLAHRLPHLSVRGVDISADMVDLAWQNAEREGLSARVRFDVSTPDHLPCDDNSIDLVVSTLSTQHWHDVPAMLQELARVVRPGGHVWLYDMYVPPPPIEAIRQAAQYLPFSPPDVERLPIQVGLLPIPSIIRSRLQHHDTR